MLDEVFRSPQNISEASLQNWVATFYQTNLVAGDLYKVFFF